MRLAIFILLTLAATSIIGTLIPQNENPADYVQAYGEFFFRLFSVFGIFDLYHSWWFQTLLLLLTANIVACSIDRLSATWRIIFVRNPSFNVSKFRRFNQREEFNVDRSPEQLKKIYAPFLFRSFGHNRIEKTQRGYCLFGEKGRWTRLGVYTVHFSVILLLAGGLIGSIFGFDGFVNIPEGEAVNSIRLGNTGKMLPLEFEIRCDDFNVSFYNSGAPKEYRSSLTIVEQGKPVIQKNIIVNDPLRYKGINMFQSSYGTMPPKDIILDITSRKTGMIYPTAVAVGKMINLPEDVGTLVLSEFKSAASFMGNPIGEAFSGTLTPQNGKPVELLLPLRFPSFDKMRRGALVLSVAEVKQRYFTGLQVTKDPGIWLVYLGFIVMIIGCYVTFFMSHQQICAEVVGEATGSRVIVCGTANKNKLGMQKKIKKISEKLAKLESRAEKHGKKSVKHRMADAGYRA